ncbi:MAG: excinuclease ABC subunit UvrA [candidate division SR1 bacterium]|nr:excinuclease ABC subunit UvrA [candidate division SR1 bacterium]
MPKSTTKTVKSTKTSPKIQKEKSDFSHFFDQGSLVFEGIRVNNLKNIDLTLPKNKLITITGVSGSGKSSLAFQTIYKEGQYRYIESLSSYLRQFFNLGDRPEIDYCSGLSPAIAIEQNKRVGNSRSTVGTLTEIDDYIRLLFAKLGDTYCWNCGSKIKPQTVDQILHTMKELYSNQRIYLLKESGSFSTKADLLKFVKANKQKVEKGGGFTRYLLVSQNPEKADPIEYFYLEDPQIPTDYFPINSYGIFDRVTLEEQKVGRLKEDIIKILSETKKFGVYLAERNTTNEPTSQKQVEANFGAGIEITQAKKSKKADSKADGQEINQGTRIQRFTDKMYCPNCNITYPEFTTQHFSPNRQEGACSHCLGIGEILQVDYNKVIDPASPLIDAILPWRDSNLGQGVLKKLCEKYSMDPEKKRAEQPERFLNVVVEGDQELLRINTGGKYTSIKYNGIEEIIKDQYVKGLLTVDFQAMLNMKTCPHCFGSRLKKESLHCFLTIKKEDIRKKSDFSNLLPTLFTQQEGLPFAQPEDQDLIKFNIRDLQKIELNELINLLELYKSTSEKPINLLERILNPLLDRAKTIQELGLGYLMLTRGVDTLSGGEIQRLRLAKQLGNKLTGIIYVLDEPTIGLDTGEIKKAIVSINKLKEMGNTIIVVEHNEEFIRASDRIVEIGPGAGDFGGELIFNGSYEEFTKTRTLTSDFITGKRKVSIDFSHTPSKKRVDIRKASKFNLKNINIKFNLGSFTVITGPSGAGKTTLMYTTLFRFLNDRQKFVQSYIRLQLLKKGLTWEEILAAPVMRAEEYAHFENLALQEFYQDIGVERVTGQEEIKNTIYVDQSSIGKTPRSCPATFVNVFDKIRLLYAGTSDAKYLGFNNSHFSFNSDKGACPACNGYGYKKIELQFLPDTYVPCELCQGKRYKPEILGITWRGKTISQVLDMYIDEALDFFSEMDHIKQELELMVEIGLGYLKMGQPAHTLSGGESQRLKLVKHLLKEYRGNTVYFLDEPTVGLHPADIEKLLKVIKRFLEKGDTILMIEHDEDILQFADHIIRLDNGQLVKSK